MATRAEVNTVIDTQNPNNTTALITPLATRTSQKAINDNSFNLATDDSDNITQGATNKFITTAQAGDIVTNTAKVGITSTQASDITTNNSKISYTDASAVALNTAKVGITPTQATIISNTSGVNTGDQTNITGNSGTVTDGVYILGNQSIAGDKTFMGSTVAASVEAFRPVINKTASFTVGQSELNKGCKLDVSAPVVIDVDSSSDTAFPIGGEVEFYWYFDSGSNSITITASGGQTIISADAAVALSKVGACAVLKKVDSNSWILTGGLS